MFAHTAVALTSVTLIMSVPRSMLWAPGTLKWGRFCGIGSEPALACFSSYQSGGLGQRARHW